MTGKTKAILGGVGVALTIFGIWGYSQYKKLMDYTIGFKKAKVRSISKNKVSFDLFLLYGNKSDITFYLVEQNYKVYINDKYVSRISNAETNTIAARSVSELAVNIEFDPNVVAKALGKNWLELIAKPDKVVIRTEMEFKVGLQILGFLPTIKVPYTYTVTLKEIMSWYK